MGYIVYVKDKSIGKFDTYEDAVLVAVKNSSFKKLPHKTLNEFCNSFAKERCCEGASIGAIVDCIEDTLFIVDDIVIEMVLAG